jgi:hypothetical protein
MNRQYIIGSVIGCIIAMPLLAQVPALKLPALPPPGGAMANPANHDKPATAAPALTIELPGPDKIVASKEAPKALPNPTDLLPDGFLNNASAINPKKPPAPADKADTAQNAETQNGDAEAQAAENLADWDIGPPAPTEISKLPSPAWPDASAQDISEDEDEIDDIAVATGPVKSWQKKLAPARIYPKTRFNYKYVVLPKSIHKTQYGRFNPHLPLRRTRQDYDMEMLKAAATNDINGIRALLDSGSNVNQINAFGDSALIIALQNRALGTARLLLARGANPDHIGKNGRTPFFYARKLGAQDILRDLVHIKSTS